MKYRRPQTLFSWSCCFLGHISCIGHFHRGKIIFDGGDKHLTNSCNIQQNKISVKWSHEEHAEGPQRGDGVDCDFSGPGGLHTQAMILVESRWVDITDSQNLICCDFSFLLLILFSCS